MTKDHEGALRDGTQYLIEVPPSWNGTLMLYSHGPPVAPLDPPWPGDQPVVQALLARGYAVAGCATTRFWPLDENVGNQLAVADLFGQTVAAPERTLAWGHSIGGLMTAALVQSYPERFDAALVICGTLGGGVGTQNQQLDCTFAFKTLAAADAPIELVNITNPPRNIRTAVAALEAAQQSPQGRARIGLAASLANIPGWYDPMAPAPAADDSPARQLGQFQWLQAPDFMVFLGARAVLESRGGGNMSWNTDVDYRRLLQSSVHMDHTCALYADAGLDLDADLDALERAPRISADPQAVTYFERHIAFDGDLGGTPVETLHSLGDGLVPIDHVGAYADVVDWAGHRNHLATLSIARGGHCAFTTAETLTAFDVLTHRVEHGRWPDLEPESLNAHANARFADDDHRLAPMMRSLDPARAHDRVSPAFVAHDPPPMARAHDVRYARDL